MSSATSSLVITLARAITAILPGPTRWAMRQSLLKEPPGRLWRHWITEAIVPTLFAERGMQVNVDGIGLAVHPRAAEYYHHGFEPLTRLAFQRLLPDSGVVVDVGANAGFYTLAAARALGDRGHVHAVEPSPGNQRLLRLNLHDARNVTLHPVAAGSCQGTGQFQITHDSLHDAFAVRSTATAITATTVRIEPLDALIKPPVRLVKMDIQGYEPEALAGMKHLIENSPGLAMIVEWDPACLRAAGYDPGCLPGLLESMGVRLESAINDQAGTTERVDDVLAFVREHPDTAHYWDVIGYRKD